MAAALMWPFRKKPPPPAIPKFRPDPPQVEPKPEPVEVHELQDFYTRTGIHKVWRKWTGEE